MDCSLALGFLVTKSIVKATENVFLRETWKLLVFGNFVSLASETRLAEMCRQWFVRTLRRNKTHFGITKWIHVSSNEPFPCAQKMGHHQFLSVCTMGQAPIWVLRILSSKKAKKCSGQVPRSRGHHRPPGSPRKGQGRAVCDHSPRHGSYLTAFNTFS